MSDMGQCVNCKVKCDRDCLTLTSFPHIKRYRSYWLGPEFYFCPQCMRELNAEERRLEAEEEEYERQAEAEREERERVKEMVRRASLTPEERAAEDEARAKREKIKKYIQFFFFIVLIVVMYQYCSDEDVPQPQISSETNQTSKNVEQTIKINYLKGVDKISDPNDLDDFFYNIASQFYNGDMGIKGSKEKVTAGNKMMEDVYSFLGQSVKGVDSKKLGKLKSRIKKDAAVSDFRKKRAMLELDSGLHIIRSIKSK